MLTVEELHAPVTAVAVLPDNNVLAGCGPYLELYHHHSRNTLRVSPIF